MATCPTCRTLFEGDVAVCPNDGARLLPDAAFAAADRDLGAGDVVGEYRIESKLGEGSYGTVYRGVHPVIGKAAAVKVLKRQYSSNPEMVSRFISEARAVNQIRHRNIIDIFSFGLLADGRHYYVMEVLEGRTLEEVVEERGRLTAEEAMPIFRQLSRALGAAHAAGICHRDIKPENVFIGFDDDGQPVPKLLDFGIAKLQADDQNRHKTRSGTPMGTPLYMSPEQIRGSAIDHRADIYSFGVLVHEVLTGSVPFDGTSVIDVLMKHTSAQAPAMSSVCVEVPAALDAPVLHMLEKDPDHRPRSIVAAVDALLSAAGVPVPASSLPGRAGSLATRSSGAPLRSTPAGAMHAGAIHAGDGRAAEARTIAAPSETGRTLRGSSSATQGSKPPGARRSWLPIAIGGGAVLAITIGLATGAGGTRAPATPPEATSAVGAPAAPPVSPREPAIQPEPATSAPAPLSRTVTLTVRVTPKDAEVWRGTEKLGTASEPLELERGDAPTKLTLRKPGWLDKVVEVPTNEPSTLSVELTRAPGAAVAPQPKKPELEF